MAVTPAIIQRGKRTLHASQLQRRQQQDNSGFSGSAVTIAIISVVIVVITGSVVLYSFLRRWKNQGKSPKYIPTQFLKSKWQNWSPGGKYSQVHNRDLSSSTAYNGGGGTSGAAIDRNASVRSTMTLPAYSRAPKDSEQVIGREGERGGMDTVIEFPETQEAEEARREDQMESLYQIRLARRREIAEREERRRERREARDRGDNARLEELRRESRQRATESATSLNGGVSVSAATLIAEHQSRGRERRVSSVAYGSLGEVRHDGTRLRANSNDSERGGLLSGAAPMGEESSTGGRPRLLSDATSFTNVSRTHTRDASISDMSISSMGSDQDQPTARAITPVSTQPGDRSRPETAQSNNTNGPDSGTSNSSPTANRFTPDESTGSEDIGESRIPHADLDEANRPPDYDYLDWGDAPSYEVAVARRAASNASRLAQAGTLNRAPSSGAPQLPQLNLPTISVSDATTPNTPVSPVAGAGNQTGHTSAG
ncbi:hypothetical protein LTR84_003501 [Exophiala bonariae]|uniref:Uncharacterized protein n=1 Tax=Exophiala bonariae TaxID=1690606 RepID=A0AAV9NAU7_9EURO|nr:hypothetical protein LTR84_003501 [Exophiala bonariae]